MTLSKSEVASLRRSGDQLINLVRGDLKIVDINQLFDMVLKWPAILNPNSSASPTGNGDLTGLYYARPFDPEFRIPERAVKKIASIMLHTQPPEGKDDEFPLNEFVIAEYIPAHAFLVAAEAIASVSPLLDQIPKDRSPEVRASMLHRLTDYDNRWFPETRVKQFVLTPDGFNMHVVSRTGFYQYYTQN